MPGLWSLDDVLAARPPIRVNQVGYLPDGPKYATLIDASDEGVDVTVRTRAGEIRWAGRSIPWPQRPDATSGMTVHTIDFSGLSGEHRDVHVVTDAATSHRFDVARDAYRSLAQDALRFFTLQRSGCAVDVAGYERPAGHLGVAPNTGDRDVAACTELYPGWHCDTRFDVSGGWYDAGDFGKYVTSGALPVWQLLSTAEMLAADSALRAAIVDECRWQLDWLLRMQVPADEQYAALAFHRVHGTQWPAIPMWPHRDPTTRVLHRPSTGAAYHLAGAAAKAARVIDDAAFADRLLGAAIRAYDAASSHPTLLAPDDGAVHGGGSYHDDDIDDDAYFAAAQLWLTTGGERYLADVRGSHCHLDGKVFRDSGFDFDQMAAPACLDLARRLPEVGEVVLDAADRLCAVQRSQPWGQPYAPRAGWEWGSNGRLLNNLVVVAAAYELTTDAGHRTAVLTGVDYLLGRNALGQCYVTGYGTDCSRHQRTRHFAHDVDPAFPSTPPGALAGGPTDQAYPDFDNGERFASLPAQLCYVDEPTSEVTNDVCIRWNAPLVHVAAFLDMSGEAELHR